MTEVTTFYLEMTDRAQMRPRHSSDPRFVVREAVVPQWQVNRFLYFFVGERWDWVDKLPWSDRQWEDYAGSGHLRTFLALYDGTIAGYYELDREEATGSVEIIYFGLTPHFIGRGLGAALLTDALERAWQWDARRVWVHTCSLDHPAALRNYEATGMTLYDRQTEELAHTD
jgi:GNAT superfamily N-acetyltransferase